MNLLAFSAILASILLICIAGYLYIIKPEPLTLTLNISIGEPIIKQGQDFQAVFSMTSNRQIAASLNYTILSRSGRLVLFDHHELTIEGPLTKTFTLTIPETTMPGPHWIRAHISSEGISTVALASIVVTPLSKPAASSQSGQSGKPNQSGQTSAQSPVPLPALSLPKTGLENPIPLPNPANSIPTHPPTISTTPTPFPDPQTNTPPTFQRSPSLQEHNPLPESTDSIRATILKKAITDPVGAANDCATKLASQQDTCYSDAALEGKSSFICQRIADTGTKDACLANLALSGDFSVCASINNPDIRDSCIALRGKTT